MKKQFVLLFALVFALAFSVKGQPASLFMPDDLEEEPGMTVLVPVYFDLTDQNFCNIDLYIGFDDEVLQFQNVVDAQLPVVANFLPGSTSEILINWFGFPPGQTAEGVFLYLQFMYLGGESEINFLVDQIEINDCSADGLSIAFSATNGFISEAPPIPLSNWAIFLGLGLIVGLVVLRMTKVI